MSQILMLKTSSFGSEGNINPEKNKGKAPAFLKNSGSRVNKIHPHEGRVFQLQFSEKIRLPVYTGKPITGETSDLKVTLIDELTGNVVESEPESSSKVELVVLYSDSSSNDEGSWSLEEFNSKIVMQEQNSLLGGNISLDLKKGVGFAGGFYFKHTRNWTRVCSYRLGARMIHISYGTRVKEAKTESFIVKDSRNMNKKDRKLSLSDEVWRLVGIGKDGPCHVLLRGENILTVEQFLVRLFLNPMGLRRILEGKMNNNRLEGTFHHARTCELGPTMHLYCRPYSHGKFAVVFKVVGQVIGLVIEGQYHQLHQLSENLKDNALELVRSAFEHWDEVIYNDDLPSLLDRFLQSSDVLSDSIRMDSNNGHNIPTYINNDEHEQTFCMGSHVNASTFDGSPDMDIIFNQLCGDDGLDCVLESENPFLQSNHEQSNLLVIPVPCNNARRRWKKISYVLRWPYLWCLRGIRVSI